MPKREGAGQGTPRRDRSPWDVDNAEDSAGGGELPAQRDDSSILRAVQILQEGGGPEAFEPVYKKFYPPLYTFFANQPALRDEAADLAQETLFRAFRKIGHYRVDSSFSGWLRRMGENVWKNAVRERLATKRGQPESMNRGDSGDEWSLDAERSVFDAGAETPEQRALAAEKSRVLLEAMKGLPAGMRRCVELRIQDFKYREIADLTGIGLNTVRSQLFEARKRLAPVLERYFGGTEL